MAIHPTVLYSPDRRIRITANPAGTVFTIERDLVFVTRLTSLGALLAWLEENGLDLAKLIVD